MSFRAPGTIAAIVALGCAALAACKGSEKVEPASSAAPQPRPPPPPTPGAGVILAREDRAPIVGRLPGCEVEHYGRLVDLGLEAPSPWAGFRPPGLVPDETVFRDGASYLKTTARQLEYLVWLDEPL
jgi:hypothetical protein